MLIKCRQCRSIIHNAATQCPWCGTQRDPIRSGKKRFQTSLLVFFVLVSAACIYLGLLIQANP